MLFQPINSGFCVIRQVTVFSLMVVALCLLSCLPSHFTVAMSVHAGHGNRRTTAVMDKELNKVMASGSGVELMEIPQSSDDEIYGKAQNNLSESDEDDSPIDDTDGLYSPEKSHILQNKRRLRLNKRYRLRASKRRLRFQKKKQAYGDDAEYGRPEESASAYERDLREPRLRFHAHDMRKRSSPWERASEGVTDNGDHEEQPRNRRSAFPVFNAAAISKRVPIGNDLQALADLLYEQKQRDAVTAFKKFLDEIGKR